MDMFPAARPCSASPRPHRNLSRPMRESAAQPRLDGLCRGGDDARGLDAGPRPSRRRPAPGGRRGARARCLCCRGLRRLPRGPRLRSGRSGLTSPVAAAGRSAPGGRASRSGITRTDAAPTISSPGADAAYDHLTDAQTADLAQYLKGLSRPTRRRRTAPFRALGPLSPTAAMLAEPVPRRSPRRGCAACASLGHARGWRYWSAVNNPKSASVLPDPALAFMLMAGIMALITYWRCPTTISSRPTASISSSPCNGSAMLLCRRCSGGLHPLQFGLLGARDMPFLRPRPSATGAS